MDLPRILGARPDAVGGAPVPYIRSTGVPWWGWLKRTYGICWHGGFREGYGPSRDLGAEIAARLIARAGGHWVSLCPGESLARATAAIDRDADFGATARAIAGLRAVVTTDT